MRIQDECLFIRVKLKKLVNAVRTDDDKLLIMAIDQSVKNIDKMYKKTKGGKNDTIN